MEILYKSNLGFFLNRIGFSGNFFLTKVQSTKYDSYNFVHFMRNCTNDFIFQYTIPQREEIEWKFNSLKFPRGNSINRGIFDQIGFSEFFLTSFVMRKCLFDSIISFILERKLREMDDILKYKMILIESIFLSTFLFSLQLSRAMQVFL